MTPYVSLQVEVIRTLRSLAQENPAVLKLAVINYCDLEGGRPLRPYMNELGTYGLHIMSYCKSMGTEWAMETTAEIIRQQLAVDGDKITILGLLGLELYPHLPMNYEEFVQNRGSGQNRLRTTRLAQPGALQEGDILATGDRLLSPPREGGNGSVLIHLTGGFNGHWIDVPARIPIALLTPEDNAPPGLVED
jgi:hypothetical protein